MRMLMTIVMLLVLSTNVAEARGPRGRGYDAVIPIRTSHYGVMSNTGYSYGIYADGWTQIRMQGYALPSHDPSFILGYSVPVYRAYERLDGTIGVVRVR